MNFLFPVILACLLPPFHPADLPLDTNLPFLTQKVRPPTVVPIQVEQEQLLRYEISPQASIRGVDNDCHVHPAQIKLRPLMSKESACGSRGRLGYSKLESVLVEVCEERVVRYRVNWVVGEIVEEDRLVFEGGNCSKNVLELTEQERVFVFSCDGVYQIGSNHLQLCIEHSGRFQAHKIVKWEELILEISSHQGIRVYSLDFHLELEFLGTVTQHHEHSLHIADALYANGTLLVLDHQEGLFMFKRQANSFSPLSRFRLPLEQRIQYRAITLWENNLFIGFEGDQESSIFEGELSEDKVVLIRYYKGYQTIKKMFIFQNKLLVESSSRVELLNVNRDPRAILNQNNGYTYNHHNSIREIHYLQNSQFLILTPNSLQISNLNIQEALLECAFPLTGSRSLQIDSACQTSLKEPFYYSCTQRTQLSITVVSSTKDSLHWLLLIASGSFLIGVVLLIYWRAREVLKIQRLVRKIMYFKQKFHSKAKAVEFQEVDHAYSDELQARSRNWNELGRANEEGVGGDEEGGNEDKMGTQRGLTS